mgnify:FL=1
MNYTQTTSSDSRKKISGSTIKIIAIITMLVGIAASAVLDRMLMKNGLADVANNTEAYQAFMESNGTLFIADFVMQLIGGLALPLFCFLLTEGFMHTSSLKKYAIGLAVVAVVSEVPFDLVYSGSIWNPYRQNPVFSLLIGLGILVLMEKAEVSLAQSSPWKLSSSKLLIAVAACVISVVLNVDSGIFAALMILVLYMFRNRQVFGMALACFLTSMTSQIFGFITFLDILPVLFYNGERGIRKKYIFYAVYPAALILFYLIVLLTGLEDVSLT